MFYQSYFKNVFLLLLLHVCSSLCWRAVPASQAKYSLRDEQVLFYDNELPRRHLHSTYKFGYCTPTSTVKQFLRKSINMTFIKHKESDLRYIYLLAHPSTQNTFLQCIVMKWYVNYKFMFFKGRLPMYYCQGQIHYMWLCLVQKVGVHEFYVQTKLRFPLTIVFEFYHPLSP